jgi:hypothetical protein
MPLTNFEPNDGGFRAIANSPEVKAALKAVAEKGKSIARGLAQDFRVTGDYADSFEVREVTIRWDGEYPGPRAAAQLVNTSDHAAAVEWGNEHAHKPHHVLGRTLDILAGEA